ncbi:MAG: GTP-binding protein, partial [Clostridia bacterium]|nr:GTP-binding protein [Clostridia bacterium]
CICCTLRKDLIDQIHDIVKQHKFDHIIIEASGICEPIPIAQTINFLTESFRQKGMPIYCKLDAIVSVVDTLRMVQEFGCGDELTKQNIEEEDIENLVIQQIEFCDVLIMNKTNEVSKDECERVRKIVKNLQPQAKLIETNFSNVDIAEILDTNLFDMEHALTSAGWFQEIDKDIDEDDHHEEHEHEEHKHEEHEHHHHHDHEGGETEEYGIGTFVYFRRKPFDRLKFEDWANKDFGKKIIRSKGLVYFNDDNRMSYIFEQAGRQKMLTENGPWYATYPKYQIEQLLLNDEKFRHDWDPVYGDRMIKLVFIGQHINKETISNELDRI